MTKFTKKGRIGTRKGEGKSATPEGGHEKRLNKFEGRLRILEARIAKVEHVMVTTANHYERRLSERDLAIEELKQQVRYALTSATHAVALMNGNQPDSGSLKSSLGPMSDIQPTPVDHRLMKRKR